ncbi:hypothetical protein [Paraclostridium bifermentans]|uniref:hypothetical protein n=1 Tax=Paraclostridium bifermentans TaxID=1490 RepID=UPI0021C493A1|nr:hypothetical protein [Paraclostridium bifermentans]GKZ05434.1 hypothetical protein ANS015_03170 [Paraclostridium bifermentans]
MQAKVSQENKQIMRFLGLSENQHIVNCMIIGYPSVKYQRTVPRKDAVISWK